MKPDRLEVDLVAQADEAFPHVCARVDHLVVGDRVDNVESIASTFYDYDVLDGVRRVPLSAFEVTNPYKLFYAKDDLERVHDLAEQIRRSKRIDPLIVVVDREGLYVLEGGHRLGALALLKKRALPALVVVDLES